MKFHLGTVQDSCPPFLQRVLIPVKKERFIGVQQFCDGFTGLIGTDGQRKRKPSLSAVKYGGHIGAKGSGDGFHLRAFDMENLTVDDPVQSGGGNS